MISFLAKKRTHPLSLKSSLILLFTVILILICTPFAIFAEPSAPINYMLFDNYGGTWADVEKSSDNYDDDNLCWAATAANILEWTGWGNVGGMTSAEQNFQYYQDHWTDKGSQMEFAWEWWFTGDNYTQGWSGWSQVTDPGGAFYPEYNFDDYYHSMYNTSAVMGAIDDYLHQGYGVALDIRSPGGHAITAWGYKYDPDTGDYLGIWVTDSDDDKGGVAPRSDNLVYYSMDLRDENWYFDDYLGLGDDSYIMGVQALAQMPVPEPLTLLLIGLGLPFIRKRKK